MPVGPQGDDGVVQIHADTAGHAHDHGLAFRHGDAIQHVEPLPEVVDEVAGDQVDALGRSHRRLQRRPLGLELLLLLDLFPLRYLFELFVDVRALVRV